MDIKMDIVHIQLVHIFKGLIRGTTIEMSYKRGTAPPKLGWWFWPDSRCMTSHPITLYSWYFVQTQDPNPLDNKTIMIPEAVARTMTAVSYIGVIVSIISLILTIITYLWSK